MRFWPLLLSVWLTLFASPALSIEVRTQAKNQPTQADRHNFHAYAKRFSETLKSHPPVTECHISLINATDSDFIDRIVISVEFSHFALNEFLQVSQKLRYITQGDRDRYIANFRRWIQNSASEVFSGVKKESIEINVIVKQ